jgi:uncharacterized repeat protein (TIGR01451 family)
MTAERNANILINMKVSSWCRVLGVFVLGWMLAGTRGSAQTFSLSVSNPPTPVSVNSTLTYTITVTNLAGFDVGALVTNTLSGPAQIAAAFPTLAIGFVLTSNATSAVFEIDSFSGSLIAQFEVVAQPSAAGFITNTVSIYPLSFVSTNIVTTNVVNQVTNATSTAQADLAVGISGPAQAVITNDYMTYQVAVSNLGPDSASGVLLTNTYSAAVNLIDISPASVPFTITNELLLLDLGTINQGAATNVNLTVQPTNAGLLTLSAAVGATTPDPNTTNNAAAINILVTNYLSGQLAVSFVDPAPHFDPQNGLMEQTIQLANVGTSAVASARVVVSGLTGTNWLFNGSGTNNGNPFAVYAATLNPTQNVNLLMQYLVPTGEPFDITTNQLPAYEVPSVVWTPPANPGTPVQITRELQLPWGDILIEFQSILGRGYTVVYSDNDSFTNAMVAPPTIAAPGDRMQWIDYGPPATTSRPAGTNSRSYRVYLNP